MSLFREYDIRGVYGQDLNAQNVFCIGLTLARYIKQSGQEAVFVGYDARVHSRELFYYLGVALSQSGVEVISIGMVPTPVAYFCTYYKLANFDCRNSIMITGSHNPPEYNGFKITINQSPFYGKSIQNLGFEVEKLLDQVACCEPFCEERYKDFLTSIRTAPVLQTYIDFLSNHFKSLRNFPYPVALDYGNGVGSLAMSEILKKLDIKCIALYSNPDGLFPNHHPDPSEEKNLLDLKTCMSAQGFEIGLGFDGDADRIALLTTNRVYKGDELGILFAKSIARNKSNVTVIGEVKCSQLMYNEINKFGKSVMYKTGHSNLKVKLKELKADLAVEMSGHIFFGDRYFGYDDAIYSGLRALELFLEKTPGEIENFIASLPKLYNTQEEKIPISEDRKFAKMESLRVRLQNPPSDFPKIVELIEIDGLRIVFKHGWGLVRASNTTPFLITRFEADNLDSLSSYKKSILNLLQEV